MRTASPPFWHLLCVLALWATSAGANPTTVFYPPPEVQQDQRGDYPVRLLQLALRKSGNAFVALPAARSMSKGRAIIELARGEPGLDILWAMTQVEREQLLLPIRIPIDKGLLGWRLAVLRREEADRLHDVKSLESLGKLLAGQGHDWPDLQILKANGLAVTGVSSYLGLFSMLQRRRIDYLPRGLTEVGAESALLRQADLVIDPHIALHYPTAMYYFVHRDRQDLADAVQRGLELALKDGSFEELFLEVHESQLLAARMGNRRVIALVNPLLPPQTPLHRAELWWRPAAPAPAAPPPRKSSRPAQR